MEMEMEDYFAKVEKMQRPALLGACTPRNWACALLSELAPGRCVPGMCMLIGMCLGCTRFWGVCTPGGTLLGGATCGVFGHASRTCMSDALISTDCSNFLMTIPKISISTFSFLSAKNFQI